MIEKLEIGGVHTKLDEDIKKYARKKIGKLDQYMGRHARKSAHAEVKLIEEKIKTRKQCTCEVILHLPKDTITVRETTLNMFAAVDIVETKLKNLLKKYKDTHEGGFRLHRRVISRFKRRGQPRNP